MTHRKATGGNTRSKGSITALLAASLVALAGMTTSMAQPAAPVAPAVTPPNAANAAAPVNLSAAIWRQALASGKDELAMAEPLRRVQGEGAAAGVAGLRSSLDALETNLAKRETARSEQIDKVNKELDEALAKEPTADNLSKALRSTVELYLLKLDKAAFIGQERIQGLINRAEAAARAAEANGDWIMANELFVRLNLLLEESARFKADVRRLSDRLTMINLYVPERLWQLRNERRQEEGMKPLPPFNATGEDYPTKLRGINEFMVLKALFAAARGNVEKKPLRTMLVGGLDAVRTMVTTKDLEGAFPGIADAAGRERFIGFLDARLNEYKTAATDPGQLATAGMLEELMERGKADVGISAEAILHEFGNGAFDRLDEFSQIFWPDQVSSLRRITDGQFIGVGVQIQTDEETQFIKIVAPLEGTPAFRAGIRAGDLIKKVGGKNALGMNLQQAIEQITGKAGTQVNLTIEREGEDMDFLLTREVIPLRTVKGWKRSGNREDEWDWFIDPRSRIGYVRITSFNESSTTSTTRELRDALAQMQAQGLNGLIFDLRFNGGGLLPQAVNVVNTFVDSGMVVYTQTGDGTRVEEHSAKPSGLRLRDVPIALLVNEGSASASEIVSGALRHYNDTGKLKTIIIGQRTFGKGSVQNVMELASNASLKLTTQYYFLPNGQLIHRRDGASSWGVNPHLSVEMLPKQISDAVLLRQDADTPLAFTGSAKDKDGKPREQPDPERLLVDGLDLQLQTALFVLQSQALPKLPEAAAAETGNKPG
jgi:carboxyl-terminal processing protease